MRIRPSRGYVLLVALVALSAMLLLVVGAIQFSSANRSAAATKARGDRLQACVSAAKRTILSRFRNPGVGGGLTVLPTELTIDGERLPDTADPSTQTRIFTAHYGSTTAEATVTVPNSGTVTPRKVNDDVNMPRGTDLGSGTYVVTVKCRDPVTESELESEFAVEFRMNR